MGPDFSPDEGFADALIATPRTRHRQRSCSPLVEDEPLKFDPGSRYEYSNSDNIVVGLMVEAATNRSYESQLQKYVFGPLGLTETSLPVGANLSKPFIHGYDPSQTPPEDVSEIIAAGWASGGIVSTPRDLNRVIRGYVGGQLFGSRVRSKQRQVIEGGGLRAAGPGGRMRQGSLSSATRPDAGRVWGHTGNTPGYTQFAAVSPDGERSVTVSVNAQLTPTTGIPAVFRALRR